MTAQVFIEVIEGAHPLTHLIRSQRSTCVNERNRILGFVVRCEAPRGNAFSHLVVEGTHTSVAQSHTSRNSAA